MSNTYYSKDIDMDILKKNINRIDNYEYYKNICNEIIKHERVLINCPICDNNNKQRDVFIKVYGIEYIRCIKCEHVYQDYLPKEEIQYITSTSISERMSKQLYEDKTKSYYRFEKVVKPKIEFVINHFPDKYSGKWLDIGCGTGELVKMISDYGWDASGIDNNKSSIEFANTQYNLGIKFGDVEQTDVEYFNDYDVMSIFLLFEHLRNPKKFFNNIAKGCKKGSMIVTEINNADSFSTNIQRQFPEKVDRHFLPCSHTNMFNYKSLKYFFDMFGFELISEWWFGQDFYELLISLDDSSSESFQKLSSASNDMQKHIDRIKYSDRLICIFKKIV